MTVLSMTIALLVLLMPRGSAQDTRPTLNFRSDAVNAVVVLGEIEKQTGYTLTYNQEDIKGITIKKINWNNTPLQTALQELQDEYGIYYSMSGNSIALKSGPKPAAAQKKTLQTGTAAGKIVDQENGDPVAGATIHIGGKGTSSDVNGVFSISLPKGKYEAMISSVGFGAKRITDIDIREGQVFDVNVALKREKNQLANVVVTASAKKESVSALYARQKNDAAITDGISAEQITRTPDRNIGESIKRISGLSSIDNRYVVVRGLSERYNQAMLNGQQMPSTELNRKQFSFDIIPSNMVDNITVAKTLTPDKSAEFGGGLIEINTKDIPSENYLNLSAGLTIYNLAAGNNMLSLKADGNRAYFGEYARHRYLDGRKNFSSLTEIRNAQAAHGDGTILQNNWQPFYYLARPSQNYQVSAGKVIQLGSKNQQKLGIMASLTYRNTQTIQGFTTRRNGYMDGDSLAGHQYGFSTSLGGAAGIGYTTKKHRISWQNLYTRLLDEQMNYGVGQHVVLGYGGRAMIERVQQTSLWQSQLKGEHTLGGKGIKVGWLGSYTYIKRIRPDNHVLIWKAPETDAPHNEFNVADWSGIDGAGSANNPGALRMFSDATEKNFSWDANVRVPFNLGITKNTFKAGYSGWAKDRRFYVALLGDYPGSLETSPPLGLVFSPKYGGGHSAVSNFGDDYHRKAPLHAVYGMFDNRIGNKIRLVWGVRGEYFNMDKVNQAIDGIIATISNGTQLDDFSALRNKEKNWQLFPSANLTYSITSKINVRAAYAKSIIRPDLRELAYFREYDFELGGMYQADFLRSTKLDNYDLRLEWYPGAGEVLSVSFFYKNVKYPMEIFQNANLYTLQNNYKSNNRGIEMEVRKSLSFLDIPIIRNLTVYGNFTALTSRVTPMQVTIGTDANDPHKLSYVIHPGVEEKRPLMGQSNYMGNAGLYYDDSHLHLSVNYNSVSNRMVIYTPDYLNWQFERPLRSLDVQLAYRFYQRRAEVKVNLANLLNESNIIYMNKGTAEEEAEMQKGHYSQSYLLYNKNRDRVIQKLTPGRSYGITLSYQF